MKASFTKALQQWNGRPPAEIELAAQRLREEAGAASTLRGYLRDPSVLALTIERTRERTERGLVLAMLLMLAFTTYTVQQFVVTVGHIEAGTVGWWLAWGVEPGIILVVFLLMRQDQVARREGVIPGRWVQAGRWVSFAFTYLMNTGVTWTQKDWGGVFFHSALPVLAFITGEAVIQGREALTRAAAKAEQRGLSTPQMRNVPASGDYPQMRNSVPAYVDPPTVPIQIRQPESPESPVVTPLRPKGYLKNVRLPEVLRELRTQGRERDTITTAEVDALLPATKYVTRAMINSAWEAIEHEEADDGAVNE